MSEITSPYIYIPDPNKSRALFNAKLYFGIPDTDPTLGANQKLVKGIQENGTSVSLDQPVLTNSGGVPELNGSPILLDISGDYSFTAHDRLDAQQYHAPNVDNPEPGSDTFSGIVITEPTVLIAAQTTIVLTSVGANESVFYLQTSIGDQGFLMKGVDYTVTNSTTIELTVSYNAGDRVVGRQNDPAGQLFPNPEIDRLIVFDTLADAVTDEAALAIGDFISINNSGGTEVIGWRYQVVAFTGATDDYNRLPLTGAKELLLESTHAKLSTYSEFGVFPAIASGIVDIDMKNGTIHSISLTENVTSITFSNVNGGSFLVSSISIKMTQDATGGRTVVWPASVEWAGGTAPTVTATANAVDWFGLTTMDGGTSWYGFSLGANFS